MFKYFILKLRSISFRDSENGEQSYWLQEVSSYLKRCIFTLFIHNVNQTLEKVVFFYYFVYKEVNGMEVNELEHLSVVDYIKSKEELSKRVRFQDDLSFKRGETIWKQGTYCYTLGIVRSGIVKLVAENPAGRDLIFTFATAGDCIGIPFYSASDVYPYSAIVSKNTSMTLLHTENLLELSLDQKEIFLRMKKHLIKLNERLFEKMMALNAKNMHGRLAGALLFLNQKKFLKEKVFQNVTRKEISEFACVSKESMIKIMNELKSDKIIREDGKEIKIIDFEMIQRLNRM